jgi:hypothetical protein
MQQERARVHELMEGEKELLNMTIIIVLTKYSMEFIFCKNKFSQKKLFPETRGELTDLVFAQLVQKVETERRAQELLQEVKKKEREASETVR